MLSHKLYFRGKDDTMINNLFKYGFHDTDVNDIKIEGNSIILYFDDGIYILDKFNNETNLSKPISMNIKIDNKYFKTIDVIEIREIFPKYRSLDFKALKKYLKNDKLGINNVYYSNFNSTVLIECGIGEKILLIFIEECLDVNYNFIQFV